MRTVPCPGCGADNDAESHFCTSCGESLSDPEGTRDTSGATRVVSSVICRGCGHQNSAQNRFCMECGNRLRSRPSKPSGVRPTGTETSDDDARAAGSGAAVEAAEAAPDAPHAASAGGVSGSEPGAGAGESGASSLRRADAPGDQEGGKTQLFVSAPVIDAGKLVRLLPSGEEEPHRFREELVVGRRAGDVAIPEDPYLSDRHAAIRQREGRFFVEDLESTNGSFVRVSEEFELRPGDRIRIGGQILEYVV